MAKIDELADRIKELEATLSAHGIRPPVSVVPLKERPDYIEFGSARHAQFLGLVEVREGDPTISLATYTSPRTGREFRLEDEMSAIEFYRTVEPGKAVQLVLQQRVGELETVPSVPEDAPDRFEPVAVYPT